ncbi:TonB-dependent receptor family protein [Rhodopseudomonas palustris]|uniref:TonB-dependent receptor n=1 Tax=Rhodopseudomonas palustris (strain BisB18) TaxID=316056 RepID=Q20XX9_RHOPB
MRSVSSRLRRALLASAATLVTGAASAQSASTSLPTITVESAAPQRTVSARKPRQVTGGGRSARQVTPAAPSPNSAGQGTRAPGSLTVPTAQQALKEIDRTPGAVAVVPDTAFKNGPANTVKDILGWVPGVLIQTRWGPDGRVSIRGSGLSRNYGNRGINIFMDGLPLNTSDGLFDLFEVDPSVYRYVEVFKGANALRYGANSLGGAINFVMPTGRDAPAFDARVDGGSFGYVKTQSSIAGVNGPADYFITASAQREDGYREHSRTDTERLNANFGYQFSPDAETRFYLNAGRWRAELPGEVTKQAALNSPRAADSEFLRQDQQRNIDTVRIANKTTLRFDDTTVDLGVFGLARHVMHPIYQWLDFTAQDYGGFVRATDERSLGGLRNRLTAGVNVLNGTIDINQYQNLTGAVKGALASSNLWKSDNVTAYAENSLYVLPNVALIAGAQFLHASREQQDRFLSDGNQSGTRNWDLVSPKVGVLWDVDPTWQVYGNISRNAEVPTFDVNSFSSPASSNVEAQTGTTYEIGTRGRRPDVTWDLSAYRTDLRNEFQCLTTSPFSPCTVVNADRTVHQGVEAGLGVALLKSSFAQDDRFWFNVAYTYSDFRFDRDATWGNNRLPGLPPHYLRAEILYKHQNGFYAGPNVEWMPQAFFADNANSLTIDPYALLNFKVGYDHGIGWSGYVEGRNLLDTRYISSTITAGVATATSALFNPGMGRAIYGGIRYRM